MEKFSELSDEFVRLPVWAREDGQDVDPSVDTAVAAQFKLLGEDPQPGDFTPAEWEHDGDFVYARKRMGGLAKGRYIMYVKITGVGVDPESPVLFSETPFEVV